MTTNNQRGRKWAIPSLFPLTALLLLLAFTPSRAKAQDASPKKDTPAPLPRVERGCYVKPETCLNETFYLANVGQQNDANEILVALRNILPPWIKVFLVASQNAIVLQGAPEEIKLAQKIIHDLDRPKKTYRLTYTLTDFDGDKRVGTQHFTMLLVSGQRTTLKQGSKIPVATGSNNDGKGTPNSVQTTFTYLDIGMNFDVTLDEYGSGVRLLSKVEQSSVAPEPVTIAGVTEPIIRQSVLSGTIFVANGKPVILGSVDVAGSTHHTDIAVAVDLVP